MTSTGSSSVMDLLDFECPNLSVGRKRRRRRNKHVNPSSQRNLVKPPPPPPKCKFRQPSLIDPDGWVVLVRCKDDESLHEFDEKLPFLAPKVGIDEAILRSHGYMRLIYVMENDEIKARNLATLLKSYSAVFVGRTHKAFVRERTIEVHDLPDGIGYDEINDALDCQFPGKSLTFDVLISVDPRRDPEREVLIVTHDSLVCNQLLNNGGLKLFDDRLTFKCTERSSSAVDASRKWRKKKTKVIPESERQCFKCYAFGHMAGTCMSNPRCKHCAGPHSHRECKILKEGDSVFLCVNCGAQDHNAASRTCPMRPGQKPKFEIWAPPPKGEQDTGSPPPEENSAAEMNTSSSGPSGPREGGEGSEPEVVVVEGIVTPPSSRGRGSDSLSGEGEEEEEYLGGEASTEEPRDSSAMASPVENVPVLDDSQSVVEGTISGVSSTTSEVKKTEEVNRTQEEEISESVDIKQELEHNEEEIVENAEAKEDKDASNEEENVDNTVEPELEATQNNAEESEDEKKLDDPDNGVLYFTGSGKDSDCDHEAPHRKTASAVASFFSDLFGAADAPSKPLDGNFVATLRSLQESVYNDIASRHTRRGASSPRERKPAKKRRLVGPLAAAAAAAAAISRDTDSRSPTRPQTTRSQVSTPEKVLASPLSRRRRGFSGTERADKASRNLAERRLRVLEQFFFVVSAILDIE